MGEWRSKTGFSAKGHTETNTHCQVFGALQLAIHRHCVGARTAVCVPNGLRWLSAMGRGRRTLLLRHVVEWVEGRCVVGKAWSGCEDHSHFGQRKRPNLVSGEWRSLLSTFPAASQTRQFDQIVCFEGLPTLHGFI